VPALADLALGAGHLSAVEVDAEVVPAEAFVSAVLAGGVARKRTGDRDRVLLGCLCQVDQGGVAAVDQVLGGQQSPAGQAGVDPGQSLGVVRGGRDVGHIRDHVDAIARAGLGEMGEEPLPAGDLPSAGIAGRGVVGRDDRNRGGRQPAVLVGAPTQTARRITVVLHDDLPQGLNLGTEHAACPVPAQMLQQPAGVIAGGVDPCLGPGGVLAQAHRAAVAASPLLLDQAVQQVRSGPGEFIQRGPPR
jgi:hypothetical protein